MYGQFWGKSKEKKMWISAKSAVFKVSFVLRTVAGSVDMGKGNEIFSYWKKTKTAILVLCTLCSPLVREMTFWSKTVTTSLNMENCC